MTKSQLITYIEYFLLFTVIALTGFEFFFRSTKLIYFTLLPVSLALFIYKKPMVNYKAVGFIMLFILLLFFQSLVFKLSYTFVITGFLRFLTYYLVASVVSTRFNTIFVNIIYFLSCISLFFYFGSNISDNFHQFLLDISKNINRLAFDPNDVEGWSNPNQTLILYTVPLYNVIRNNGPFWEPGMFAVFINIAFAIHIIKSKRLSDKKSLIFLITSITTFSTTSLIASFIIVSYYFLFIKRNFYSLFFLIALLIFFTPIYNSPYIKGKLDYNIEIIDESQSRFGAAIFHWEEIKKSPLIGYRAHATADNQKKFLKTKHVSPNGLTNVIRIYGVPFSILLFILLYKFSKSSIKQICDKVNKGHVILLFIVILTVAFSQDVTTRHFYYVLYFIPLVKMNYAPRNTIRQ